MKKYNSLTHILGLACACLILIGCATTQPGAATAPIPANSGHLLINRVANFGSDLSLTLSVDGKDVGSFSEGRSYSGYLTAGQHVITGRVDPFQPGKGPARMTITVQAGQTYSYTAAFSAGNLVFVRNKGQSVPVY